MSVRADVTLTQGSADTIVYPSPVAFAYTVLPALGKTAGPGDATVLPSVIDMTMLTQTGGAATPTNTTDATVTPAQVALGMVVRAPTVQTYVPVNVTLTPAVLSMGLTVPGPTVHHDIIDTFTRANNSTTLGSTTTGDVWTMLGVGQYGTLSNQAYNAAPSGVFSTAVVDASADGTFQIQFPVTATGVALMYRVSDANNYWAVYNAGTTYQVYRTAAGVTTLQTTIAQVPANGDTVAAVCSGTSHTIVINGISVAAFTSSVNQNNVRAGFQMEPTGSTGRADNFLCNSVTTAAPVTPPPVGGSLTARVTSMGLLGGPSSAWVNEAHPHGVPGDYTQFTNGFPDTPQSTWTNCVPWFTLSHDNAYPNDWPGTFGNSRLEIRNFQGWVLTSGFQWVMYSSMADYFEADAWAEDFGAQGTGTGNPARSESDGGYSIRPVGTHNVDGGVHGWAGRADIASGNRGVLTIGDIRVVKDNTSGTDDRATMAARYLIAFGASYWRNGSSTDAINDQEQAVYGKFCFARADGTYRTICATNISQSDFTAHPPTFSYTVLG